jgi:hypothetical protein
VCELLMDIKFTPLFWFFGIIGAVVGVVGAAVMFLVVRLVQEHWR